MAPLLALYLSQTNLIIALAPIFLSHLLLLYATLVPNCQWWGPVIQSFRTTQQEVWLTIDDGPSPDHTTKFLDLLERFNARATFFVIGKRAQGRISTSNYGNPHAWARDRQSYLHASKWNVLGGWPGENRGGNRSLRGMARSGPDRPARFFRAPAGLRNFFVHPELARRGLLLIGWTVRGLDTVQREPVLVVERILREVKAGAIILLHEGHRVAKDPEFGPRSLEMTLSGLAERGYRCVIPRLEVLER